MPRPRAMRSRRHPSSRRTEWNNDLGSASVELVLVTPVLIAILVLLVAGGRLAMTGIGVESAAAAAARAVSLAPSSMGTHEIATDTASRSLSDRAIPCTHLTVTVDAAALDAMLGVTGTVTVTLTCTVALSDVALPGIGGARTITASANSPVDAYRARE